MMGLFLDHGGYFIDRVVRVEEIFCFLSKKKETRKMSASGRRIGVLGCSIDKIYPPMVHTEESIS